MLGRMIESDPKADLYDYLRTARHGQSRAGFRRRR
jgi:hypothetical protein